MTAFWIGSRIKVRSLPEDFNPLLVGEYGYVTEVKRNLPRPMLRVAFKPSFGERFLFEDEIEIVGP